MADGRQEPYFGIDAREQAELLQSLAVVMGRRAEILEKDVWLCLVLDELFRLPCRKPMAFKGGTSLSKVYRAIERFSEDIDVTVDYRSLLPDMPDLEALTSNSQRSRLSEMLKAALTTHLVEELVPALQAQLFSVLPDQPVKLEMGADGEQLWVYYPSAVENADSYLRSSILIEFGGRNSTLPQNTVSIVPDIAEHVSAVGLPVAEVNVLSAVRTFWEKATLIHVECHRPALRPSAQRLSRHWYDLAKLADHEVGRIALEDASLFTDVLRIKETFYRSSFSHYELCLRGGLRLVPDSTLLEALRRDYQAMLSAQMFYGDALAFDAIVERLRALEGQIQHRYA